MKLLLTVVIGLLLAGSDVQATITILEATLPTKNISKDWDYVTQESVAVCYGDNGSLLTDLKLHRLWGYPSTGGGWRIIREHLVAGMEGQVDTFHVDPLGIAWHLYSTAIDSSGNESCANNVIVIGAMTGVDSVIVNSRVVKRLLFDVRGRKVELPLPVGIYYQLEIMQSGKTKIRKIVVLR